MRSRLTAAATGALVAALVLPTATATAAPAELQLSEIRIDQPGSDVDEYAELSGTADASLDGITYLVLGDGSASGSGTVEAVVPLDGTSIGPNGFFLLGEASLSLATPDLVATLNFENSDNVTHLLVDGFGGSLGDDLDSDDDGTLDLQPWTTVVDAVGLVETPTGGEAYYGEALGFTDVGPDGSFVPGHVVRAEDGTWDIGSFDLGDDSPTAGTPDDDEPTTVCDTAAEDLTPISAIQGADADPDARSDSPLHGEEHTIRAVVTLADSDLDGYFVQEEPTDEDGDPATSEGLFVRQTSGTLPREGQTVELTDTVTASFGLTSFSAPATEVCDVPLTAIEPTGLVLPLDRDGREALESMLVTTTQDLQVTGLFSAYAYGELGLALDGPLQQPTSVHAPDDPAATDLLARNAASFLKVDDRDEAFSSYNPFPWERFDEGLSAGDTMAAGDVLGALSYSFGEFKVEPLDEELDGTRIFFPETADTHQRPPAPALEGGNDVVAFNVLNYFNDFGDSDVLRGARSAEDFEVQTAKIVDAIVTMDAAVYGLVELENDYEDHHDGDPATVPAIQVLVDALNEATAPGTYDWVVPDADVLTTEGLGGGGLGTDAIAQGLVYQPARAEPVGPATTFDIDSELTGDAENNRWPLAQTFRIDGEWVTVVVNHLKSKGSTCTDTAGPGFAFGDDVETALTGNCDLTRTHAAERLLAWVRDGATPFQTTDVLLIGDFNAYEEEDPIRVLLDAGFTDLVAKLGDDAATFKFDGRHGRLDHAFASPSLAAKVTDAAVWQANSPEPVGFLYDNHPVDETAYASSDHDPVVVALAPGVDDRRPNAAGHGNRR